MNISVFMSGQNLTLYLIGDLLDFSVLKRITKCHNIYYFLDVH